jgi:hypothetical protein
LENTPPAQIAATMTLEVIGLVLGTAFRCAHAGASCTNLVMSVDKPSMRSSSWRQSKARSWMMRIMRSDSRSEHWARMPCNSVYRARPAQPKGTNWPKASKASHYRPSRAAPLCKSLLAGDPIIGNIRFTSHERGRPQLSRSAARRQQAFPRGRNRTWPSTRREYPIPVFGPGAGEGL